MPRRSILSAAERDSLLALPETQEDMIRLYTFKEEDLSLIRQRRGDANRLGVALQLCLLRYPGQELAVDGMPPAALIQWVSKQLRIDSKHWGDYGARSATRREHLLELREYLGLTPFGLTHYRQALRVATAHALQTDKGLVLAKHLLESLRQSAVIVPALDVIERLCSEALTRANRSIYSTLTEVLTPEHRHRLDRLLKVRVDDRLTQLAWLRQSPIRPNSRHMLEHIERLRSLQALDLPEGMERLVHQNRLLKIAREGSQMTPSDLAKFEQQRRHATLAAQVLERRATVTDEVIDLHDRIIGRIFNAAKNRHHQQFQAAGKAINEKVRLYAMIGQALLEAREAGTDAFAAIEGLMSWEAFRVSVAEAQKLAQPDDFDFLPRVADGYATLRRYAPEFLSVLQLRAAPAAQGAYSARPEQPFRRHPITESGRPERSERSDEIGRVSAWRT